MNATQDQIAALGKAARHLLRFAWAREPRSDLTVTNGLIAVAKTFASDPSASSALLRQAIEPDHLKEHGYKELRWIAQHIKEIVKDDPDLAIDIYAAAYGYAEDSKDATNMGNSVILQMRSNKRQDYEGAWYQLSEAIPAILNDNLEAGVSAIARALSGYVQRERNHAPYPEEPSTASFSLGASTANFSADWSHSWYRGGLRPVQDGPVLLKKFEEFLERLGRDCEAQQKMGRLLAALLQEPEVVAAIWGCLLVAGTNHPSVFARRLLPLACAPPIMLSSDTRHQVGNFIGAAYESFAESQREAIERAVLALPDDRPGKKSKAALSGCIPKRLTATAKMRSYVEVLEKSGELVANIPPIRFTTSFGAFDTNAYLKLEGVSLEDPKSGALRGLMRGVVALSGEAGAPDHSLSSVKRRLAVLVPLHAALSKRFQGKVPDKLFEHATGQLADAAERIAHAEPKVLSAPSVKGPLKRILLFCANSENPRYNAKHAKEFHENLSWAGPSARVSAALGLICLTRASKAPDTQIMAAIRKLARDRMPEVRLQIVQNLFLLQALDPGWVWSEVEHCLAKEVTRGVVVGAIDALARIAHLDIPRSIRAAKGVMRRYQNKNQAGMAACRSSAADIIIDLHIYAGNDEADAFATARMQDVIGNAESIKGWIARYSDNLVVGNPTNPQAADNRPRLTTLVFYGIVTERAFHEIEERFSRLDLAKFNTWPETDQLAVREMFGILDEVSIRIHFAAGADREGSRSTDDVSPEHVRLYRETKPILTRLARVVVAETAHHLIQALETFVPIDPPDVFALIAQSVKSAEQGGYSGESMAADLIVRIVQRYLADYRAVFVDRARLDDLMDCLDVFVRAGWPAAQALTFKLGEIWR
jgi:hypothetical protein